MYMYKCKCMSCIYSMSCIDLYMCISSQSQEVKKLQQNFAPAAGPTVSTCSTSWGITIWQPYPLPTHTLGPHVRQPCFPPASSDIPLTLGRKMIFWREQNFDLVPKGVLPTPPQGGHYDWWEGEGNGNATIPVSIPGSGIIAKGWISLRSYYWPHFVLWNTIFTLYYTRVWSQCDSSILGRHNPWKVEPGFGNAYMWMTHTVS